MMKGIRQQKKNSLFFQCFFVFCIINICNFTLAFSQDYDEPSAMRWRKIETQHFRIVFPHIADTLAFKYANSLEAAYMPVSRSLNNYYSRKIPLVLHINDFNSNASVSFAPRQMDFRTAPLSDLYTTTWPKSLSLHEFRHYVQISKYNNAGLLKLGSFLFGDYASLAWANMLPDWFFEGDATYSETAMSLSGRGRTPQFLAAYRAYFLSDVNFSYDKWMFGSYKNYIPNSYAYGYVQTSYARKLFGNDVWEKTLTRTQTKSFPLFSKSFRKTTNKTLKELQTESFAYLKNTWLSENRKGETNVKYTTDDAKNYTCYSYPICINSDSIVAVKTDLKRLPMLVVIDKLGNENKLCDVGYVDKIYLNDRKIFWIETNYDTRWSAKSLNTIRFYDLNLHKIKTVASKTNYRAIGFANGEKSRFVVAAEYTRDGKNFICVLNAQTFELVTKMATPENAVPTSLAIVGENIFASFISDSGASLQMCNFNGNNWKTIISPSPANIANICACGNKIMFESGFDGVDNIYAVNINNSEISRLTNSKYGATMPQCAANNDLLYSEYYSNGQKIAQKKLQLNGAENVNWEKPYKFDLAETIAAQEKFVIDTVDINKNTNYSITKYNKLQHLFRVRNWMPFYTGISPEEIFTGDSNDDDDDATLGATILSQNLLGDATALLAYSYNNGYSAVHGGFTYSGLYPIITIEGHYGGGKNKLINNGVISNGNNNKFNVEATAYVPLVFSNARWYRGITPAVKLSLNNTKFYAAKADEMRMSNLAEYSLSAYVYKNLGLSDIFPRWGAILNLRFNHSPFDNENFGNFYGGKITAYVPGLLVNHGLKISALFQKQKVNKYFYSTIYDFPREIGNEISKKMIMFSGDYSFPVAYPDLSLGSFAYITRVRANLFCDYARNENNLRKYGVYSYGADVLFDSHFFRMPYPVSVGVRLYKTKYHDFGAKLILNIDL